MIEAETIIDGRYRVLSRLGSGGMAEVYLAEDQLLGRQVAVKVLHQHFAEDQEFVERFRREASSAAALSHQNIVGIFDRGEWNGTYYIAMEYVAGRSLKSIVRDEGPLDPATAIDIVVQILRGARFAHKRGVVHRDLKPHNVILDEEGRARVTDFGIARAGASDMTLTGSIMGTAQYLSPEQAQGLPVSAASDLYSIGVILYELLTGVVPFEGETAVAIAFKQVSAEPRPPSMVNPALPVALDAVVLRALAKDPAQRYADAEAFITALQRERRALPESLGAAAAAPPGPPQDGYGTGPLLLPAAASPSEEYGSPPDHRRRRVWLWSSVAVLVVVLAVLAALLIPKAGRVTVPDLIGLTEQTASLRLRAAGLQPVPSSTANAKVASGVVFGQTPASGQAAKKGSGVTILISTGPPTAPLAKGRRPDRKGGGEHAALRRLQAHHGHALQRDGRRRHRDHHRTRGGHQAARRQHGDGGRLERSRSRARPRCRRRVAGRRRSGIRDGRPDRRYGHPAGPRPHRPREPCFRSRRPPGARCASEARSTWSWRRRRRKPPCPWWWGRPRRRRQPRSGGPASRPGWHLPPRPKPRRSAWS